MSLLRFFKTPFKCTQIVFTLALAASAAGLHANEFNLRITEVNALSDQVEVTNVSQTTVTVAANLPFSHKANTASFIAAGTVFAPGQSSLFAVTGLDSTASDLWLFSDTSFTSPGSVIAGLQWGGFSIGRTSIAVAGGKWPAESFFVPSQSDISMSLRATKYAPVLISWEIGTPSPGQFFGTGTAIDNPIPETITKGNINVGLVSMVTGLVSPITVLQPELGSGKLFIADQVGVIQVYENGALLPQPLLDVRSRLVTLRTNFDERGLLGLAAHPNFASNKRIYTYTSESTSTIPADFPSPVPPNGFDHTGVLAEWTIDSMNPNIVDVSTRREILRVNEPQFNHNGGTLQFGPDGNLYLSLGDGGNRDDEGGGHLPDGNGQSLTNPLGKILRIQIDGGPFSNGKYGIPAGNPFIGVQGAIEEIWAYGLRNPFFYSFDQGGTNQLFCGDVGQGKMEEVNIILPGRNYGWRLKEGSFYFDPNGGGPGFVTDIPVLPLPPQLEEPVAEYDHDEGISIIGGFVYRGSALPQLQGSYIFGDFGTSFVSPSGRLFYTETPIGPASVIKELRLQQNSPFGYYLKGFGQDRQGEVYVCGSRTLGPSGTTGVVFKISPQTAASLWELYE